MLKFGQSLNVVFESAPYETVLENICVYRIYVWTFKNLGESRKYSYLYNPVGH